MEQSPSWEAIWFSAGQEFPPFCGSRKFIATFTNTSQLSLSWARYIQFMPPHHTSWRSILILSSQLRLGLPSVLVPLGFPIQTLHTPLLSSICTTCLAHHILLDLITELYWVSSTDHKARQYVVFSTRRCSDNKEIPSFSRKINIFLFCWRCISIHPFHPNPANKQSTEKHNTYQLLYTYSILPDDGPQICPKHVEFD